MILVLEYVDEDGFDFDFSSDLLTPTPLTVNGGEGGLFVFCLFP